MNATDQKIAEILGKFGEPMAGNVWRVQGTAVVYHKTLERIAAQAGITWDLPTIVRAEREEAAILVAGRMKDRMEWSIGEATIGMNYRVSGKQAAYPWAMAEKRAKDRVILKLIELSGFVYSEEEADEFREGRPGNSEPASPVEVKRDDFGLPQIDEPTADQKLIFSVLGMGMEKARNASELEKFKEDEIKPKMEELTKAQQDEITALYKDRYRSLGRRAA